jgi:phosphoribosylaminoimidazolecarboxamide formyltransferase/IMP cyclohydrolase
VEILSTGGTASYLEKAGVPILEVSSYTGFPEMMDGRVKTLHPKIHGGLLALRDHPEHQAAMQAHEIGAIDLVVVNLYPFAATVARGAAPDEVIENIDIGGPSMVRSAAKNHRFVTIITNPDDYTALIALLDKSQGQTDMAFRQSMAARAFAHTASYDAAIAHWCQKAFEPADTWPLETSMAGTLRQSLRYGENPHQRAAFYVTDRQMPGVANAKQLAGKELSYNNINDTDAAFLLASEFDRPACAIIKHANPCGVATADSLADAYAQALACDPVSAFGGIIALNQTVDAKTAVLLADLFAEVIIAPDFAADAQAILTQKPNLRLLASGQMANLSTRRLMAKTVEGGLLVQDVDVGNAADWDWKLVTKQPPAPELEADMRFAFRVVKHVKSNAIVIAKNHQAIGIGGGQTSRVDAVEQAIARANRTVEGAKTERTRGAVLASDAFFPFPDNIALAAKAGIAAIIQPGGSKRDDEVIAAANEAGIAMVFTGMRHFRH